MDETIEVGGIWLRSRGANRVEVLARVNGEWRVVIPDEYVRDQSVSHIVEVRGIKKSPVDVLTAA